MQHTTYISAFLKSIFLNEKTFVDRKTQTLKISKNFQTNLNKSPFFIFNRDKIYSLNIT